MKAHKYLKKIFPKLTDYLLGTDADTANKTTRNFQLVDIKNLVLESIGLDNAGGKLRVTEIEIATLITDISTTVNAMTEYIVNKSEIVFFNVAGSVYVLKQSDVTIGLGADPLTNDDFLLLASESGITALTEASDFPSSYTGHTLKLLRVNAAGNAVEFVADNSIKQVAIEGTNLTITSGVVTIPNASVLQAGLVSNSSAMQTFFGKKTFQVPNGAGNNVFVFEIKDNTPGANKSFISLSENGWLRVLERVFFSSTTDWQPGSGFSTIARMSRNGNRVSLSNQDTTAKGITIDLDTGNVSIGNTLTTTSIFELFSTTKVSRPFPLMTNAQKDAISGSDAEKLGGGVFVTDASVNQGLWMYYTHPTPGWKQIATV